LIENAHNPFIRIDEIDLEFGSDRHCDFYPEPVSSRIGDVESDIAFFNSFSQRSA